MEDQTTGFTFVKERRNDRTIIVIVCDCRHKLQFVFVFEMWILIFVSNDRQFPIDSPAVWTINWLWPVSDHFPELRVHSLLIIDASHSFRQIAPVGSSL